LLKFECPSTKLNAKVRKIVTRVHIFVQRCVYIFVKRTFSALGNLKQLLKRFLYAYNLLSQALMHAWVQQSVEAFTNSNNTFISIVFVFFMGHPVQVLQFNISTLVNILHIFAFSLVLGHSNFNNALFQWFCGFFWDALYIRQLLI
jgi:hypothetical protein